MTVAQQPSAPAAMPGRGMHPMQANAPRIPTGFQFVVAFYILLTGAIPTIIQATVFGLKGGGGDAFMLAMASELALALLMIAPLFILSNHPLGILHPLLLAVVVWPTVLAVPSVLGDFGGWAGVLSGSPVSTPYFYGLPGRAASAVWLGVAKVDAIRILGLLSVYLGFFATLGSPDLKRHRITVRHPASIRVVMLGLIVFSIFILMFFIRARGGLNEHLTSLGGGRFKELSSFGPVILLIQLGAIAVWIWIAAAPSDIKSPLFLSGLAVVLFAEFVSNGSRSGGIEVPMAVGLIWALRTQKIPWRTALLLAPLLFAALGLLGAVRSSSWSGSNAAAEAAKADWSTSFTRAQGEIAERRAESADVPVVERGQALTNGPLLGTSYAAALLAPIPRPLWPDKPRGVGSLYAQLFLGAAFEGTTIPLRPETEMYWNFGLVGVAVLSFIYGALLRVGYYFFFRRYPDPFATVFYYMFITTFQFSSNRLVPFEQRVGLLLLCYGLAALLVRGQTAGQWVRGVVHARPGLATGAAGPQPPTMRQRKRQ